jgi:hypothetical protein
MAIKSLRQAALKAGKKHPRVAACGERAGRLWADGKTDEAMQIERLINELAKSHAIDILCTYPSPDGHRNGQMYKDLCAAHSTVLFR